MNPHQTRQTYHGYAFESFCTSEQPDSPRPRDGWGGDVDTNVQWCNVVKTKLGAERVVIGGEVDCIRGKYTRYHKAFGFLTISRQHYSYGGTKDFVGNP